MRYGPWVVGAVLLIAALVAAVLLDLDLRISESFFDGHGPDPWPRGRARWVGLVDLHGNQAVAAIGVLAGLWCLRSARSGVPDPARRRRRQAFLLLVLLGAGGVIHATKYLHGRPRPRNVYHWQRPESYHEFYEPGGSGEGRSFPSGHAGFAGSLVPGAAWWFVRRRTRVAMLVVTSGWAGLVGFARIASGAHFLTDVLGSFAVLLFCAFLLQRFYVLPFDRRLH